MIFALKVDVDTHRGMREGLPRLLDLFAARRIRASVFVSMGPDHSGRAIRRLFTKRGFLRKMLRTRAPSLYGPRTILYGTLLPGPRIAETNADLFRRSLAEGHEAGVHGWDHVRWQDGVPKFSEEKIERELRRAFEVFEAITGRPPRAVAAPGWIANARTLAVQDRLGLDYAADVRGKGPFFPRIAGRVFRTLQIPTTLPTLDEMMGRPELFAATGGAAADSETWMNVALVREASRQAGSRPEDPVVHTVHTEVEGMSRLDLFADLLDRLLAEGARFVALSDIASERLGRSCGTQAGPDAGKAPAPTTGTTGAGGSPAGASQERGADRPVGSAALQPPVSAQAWGARAIPICEVRDGPLPGRSGVVACQRDA